MPDRKPAKKTRPATKKATGQTAANPEQFGAGETPRRARMEKALKETPPDERLKGR